MRSTKAISLLLPLLVLTGCGASALPMPVQPAATPPAAQTPPPLTPPPPANPAPAQPVNTLSAADLAALGDPRQLQPQELADWLARVANQGKEPLLPRLQAVLEHWYPGWHDNLLQADLNNDGTPEVIVALGGPPAERTAGGGLFVLNQLNGRYAVDASLNRDEDMSTIVSVRDVADLTGAGHPQIIWSTDGRGAHSTSSTVRVSSWKPGHLQELPGERMFITFLDLKRAGRDLLLTGGGAGSVGAGTAQRGWTDRYRWVDGRFAHVDRVFTPSSYSYHRLQDGIVAEQYIRTAEARQSFQEAMAEGRPSLPDAAFSPPDAQQPKRLGVAVAAFARFRLGALLLGDAATAADGRQVLEGATGPFAGLSQAMLHAPARAQGCAEAANWARHHPEFLPDLNSPFGYAPPHWQADGLCSPL